MKSSSDKEAVWCHFKPRGNKRLGDYILRVLWEREGLCVFVCVCIYIYMAANPAAWAAQISSVVFPFFLIEKKKKSTDCIHDRKSMPVVISKEWDTTQWQSSRDRSQREALSFQARGLRKVHRVCERVTDSDTGILKLLSSVINTPSHCFELNRNVTATRPLTCTHRHTHSIYDKRRGPFSVRTWGSRDRRRGEPPLKLADSHGTIQLGAGRERCYYKDRKRPEEGRFYTNTLLVA